jgi:hypothetical protein
MYASPPLFKSGAGRAIADWRKMHGDPMYIDKGEIKYEYAAILRA